MRVAGLISGTSHDAVDVLVAQLRVEGELLTARVLVADAVPYPEPLRTRLAAALPPGTVPIGEVCALDTAIGRYLADVAATAIDRAGGADLVCSHGQTVFHGIGPDGRAWGTLQLGEPAWIAERTGLPVVAGVRTADVAAGGQGAPLVPILDAWLLAGVGERPVAVNLGGIANITVTAVPGRAAAAYDTGPANALLDAVVTAATDGRQRYDRDGALARAGTVDADALTELLAEPYYARPAPKSTGKELFHSAYLRGFPGLTALSVPDTIATLVELTARTVASAVTGAGADVAVVSGGGVRNPVLMQRIRALTPGVRVTTSAEVGVDPDLKEALLMAVLGWCTWNGVPATVPDATGAGRAVLVGSVTPGRDGRWPTTGTSPTVRRLRVTTCRTPE